MKSPFSNPSVVWVCGNGVNAAVRILELNLVLKQRYMASGKGMLAGIKIGGVR